jgi:hypothetical protein
VTAAIVSLTFLYLLLNPTEHLTIIQWRWNRRLPDPSLSELVMPLDEVIDGVVLIPPILSRWCDTLVSKMGCRQPR